MRLKQDVPRLLRNGWVFGYRLVNPYNPYRKAPDTFSSIIRSETKYVVGRITKPLPGNGPLCVFKTKASAFRFGAYHCFLCLYKPSTKKEVWLKNSSGMREVTPIKNLCQGKALASAVILLCEVEE